MTPKEAVAEVKQLRTDISDVRYNLDFMTTRLIKLESGLTDYIERTGELTETMEDFLEEETPDPNPKQTEWEADERAIENQES